MSDPALHLPYSRQIIDEEDIDAVVGVLQSNFLTTGPEVAAFEESFAAATSATHAVATSSGTAALHLAAIALGLGPGMTAIVPAVTFVATANAVRYTGADIVFADVDPATGLMGPSEVSAALDRSPEGTTGAVIPVHLNGQSCDMASIRTTIGAEVPVLEDACHALGGTANGHPVGSCQSSNLAMFSLHPVKAIAMGEGGVLTTNDGDLAARLRLLRNHGLVTDSDRFRNSEMARDATGGVNPWYYELHALGLNYRASDIHCALGRSQLKKLSGFVARRRALAAHYDAALADLSPVLRPITRVPWSESGQHLYAVLIDFDALGFDRAHVMRTLRARGIGTQVHYIPVHRQPYYAERHPGPELSGADRYYAQCLSLPLHPAMTEADTDRVASALVEILAR